MVDLPSASFVRTRREDPADAELLGVPHAVVVGRRAADGVVEVRDRASGEAAESRLDDVARAVTR